MGVETVYRYHLKDAVLEGGIPFDKGYGMPTFVYHGKDQRFANIFNNGMSNHSTIVMKKILEVYEGFEGFSSVVDVGGGIGASLHMVVSKYPNIKGTNFDLPHVIENSPSFTGTSLLYVRFIAFFEVTCEQLYIKIGFVVRSMQVLNMLKVICLLVFPKEMPSSLRLANENMHDMDS